ncbi:MAG: CDP-diacylglycerol--serine O-phosphatidyltransferase [Puniceicoccales bacterium]
MPKNEPKIYLLPNLMTAGNLFCGFAAVLSILEGALQQKTGLPSSGFYHRAILFILGAFLFDLLDGRVARLGGFESPFGREFDSLADLISFGVAPALLVFQIVLAEFDRAGWMVAFVYLVCGALRLARFNCVAAESKGGASSSFDGFPIPAAAGLTASLTLMMLWFQDGDVRIGAWKYALPALMLFLSFMMFSRVSYPSFKAINWRMEHSMTRLLVVIVVIVFTLMNWRWMPAVLFTGYLVYGLVTGRKKNKELAVEEDDSSGSLPESGSKESGDV